MFPMGFPFLAGPGTIVTTILLMQAEGPWFTALAAVLVYAAILPLLHLAPLLHRAVGRVGILVVARILYIFVAAKAVTFVLGGAERVLCRGVEPALRDSNCSPVRSPQVLNLATAEPGQ